MRVDIRDASALQAISSVALSAYARSAGWRRIEGYGEHSDVYAAEEMPEVILPRTERLGDYASVVSRLITIFAEAAGRDELSLYRDLVTADRDVVRARVAETDDGSLTLNHGVDLIVGAQDLVLAAACSLREPQALYRVGANREANDLLESIRLGQTGARQLRRDAVDLGGIAAAPGAVPGVRRLRRPNRTTDDKTIERSPHRYR